MFVCLSAKSPSSFTLYFATFKLFSLFHYHWIHLRHLPSFGAKFIIFSAAFFNASLTVLKCARTGLLTFSLQIHNIFMVNLADWCMQLEACCYYWKRKSYNVILNNLYKIKHCVQHTFTCFLKVLKDFFQKHPPEHYT